jgi:hypothetical protein
MLRLRQRAGSPVAGPGDVVVDVHAAIVNAADYKMRLGGYSRSLTEISFSKRPSSGPSSRSNCRLWASSSSHLRFSQFSASMPSFSYSRSLK